MIIYNEIFHDIIQQVPCCEIRIIPVENLNDRERNFFREHIPFARTAIILGHHVTTKEEWIWYENHIRGEYCAADDHTAENCSKIKQELNQRGYPTQIVKYPGESGLQFRFVAQSAGMGKIGRNAFLLHPVWGPWIHLRVIATKALIEYEKYYIGSICTNCGECVSSCPAAAFTNDTFNGLRCRSFRKSKWEFIPVGPKKELRYCEICALVCPIGNKPQKQNKKIE